MWGNATGWTISAVLLFLLAMTAHALIAMGNISPPTPFGTDPQNLGDFTLPTSPASVLQMTDPTDATQLYRAALDETSSHAADYRDAFGAQKLSDVTNLPAIKDLIAATHARSGAVFANNPGAIITFDETPQLDHLKNLGHLLTIAAIIEQADDPAAAVKYFEAEFALADRLYQERLTAAELTLGIEMFAESAAGMTRALDKANQHDRAAIVRQFNTDRLHFYTDRIVPMLKVIRSIDPTTVANHAGDIFYIADHAKERMWRIEAIFALGRMRYFVGTDGRIGDQRGASRILKKLEQDPDPLISLAATKASDLTIEQYRAQW